MASSDPAFSGCIWWCWSTHCEVFKWFSHGKLCFPQLHKLVLFFISRNWSSVLWRLHHSRTLRTNHFARLLWYKLIFLVHQVLQLFCYRKQRGNMIFWMWGVRVMKVLKVWRMLDGFPSKQDCSFYWVLLSLLHLPILWLMWSITFLMLQVFQLSSFPSFFYL